MTTSARDTVLDVRQLNAWYGQAHILFDVDLNVQRGDVVALLGRNGAGKSTTLKSLMGLVRSTGTVQFMGENIHTLPAYQRARRGMGYVPEDRRIFTDLTVAENLRAGRQPARHWPDGSPAPTWDVERLVQSFPNLAEMLDRRGDQMSGGEQQMLSVARTLMGNPYLVLLDEPSEGVAPIIVESMVAMIRTLKARGVSVILAEQNIGFASLVCNRAYVLEKGQIQYAGPMVDLLHDTDRRRSFLEV
ncbi:MAG TPA: ABC transporter ATP-binding protein [Burkholderiaceae bacterium]|nr:ABC transporter ATP-binding protein [Burkholderiaceae bacterium]